MSSGSTLRSTVSHPLSASRNRAPQTASVCQGTPGPCSTARKRSQCGPVRRARWAPPGGGVVASLAIAGSDKTPMDRRAMFARVITAQAGAEGFDEVVRLAQHEISGAQQRPGFAGFYLLTDDETGKLINISLWETREEMEAVARGTAAGIHDEAVPETGVTSLRLETYEVAMQV